MAASHDIPDLVKFTGFYEEFQVKTRSVETRGASEAEGPQGPSTEMLQNSTSMFMTDFLHTVNNDDECDDERKGFLAVQTWQEIWAAAAMQRLKIVWQHEKEIELCNPPN